MLLSRTEKFVAVPGFPLDPRCMGTNKLIKDGAYLLESSADIISNMVTYDKLKKSLEETQNSSNNFKLPIGDDNLEIKDVDRQVVIRLLSSSPVTFELLSNETKLPLPVIYTICLELELAGRIVRHVGNKISLIY